MKKELTYKQVYILTIAILAVVTACAFMFSFKNTIDVISQYGTLHDKVESIKDAPQKLTNLESKIKQMEHLLIDADEVDTEQLLLEKTTNFCKNNGLLLVEFPQTSYTEYQGYQILTNKIALEGGFINQVRFIHDSEKTNRTGMVASIQVSKKKDIRTKKERLVSNIYFQNIKLKNK